MGVGFESGGKKDMIKVFSFTRKLENFKGRHSNNVIYINVIYIDNGQKHYIALSCYVMSILA